MIHFILYSIIFVFQSLSPWGRADGQSEWLTRLYLSFFSSWLWYAFSRCVTMLNIYSCTHGPFEKCPFGYISHFLSWIIHFWVVTNSLYITCTSPSSDIWFTNMLSHFECFLFIFLMKIPNLPTSFLFCYLDICIIFKRALPNL